MEGGAAAFRTDVGFFLGDDSFAALGTVISGNSMSPPELTGNTPVLDVFHPVIINLVKAFRDKFGFTAFHRFNGGLCKRLHLHKPLFGNTGLYCGRAAVAFADVVVVILYLYQVAALFQVGDNRFSRFIPFHAGILSAVIGHVGVIGHHVDYRQIMAQANLKVIRVMRRGDLYHAGSEFHINIIVGDNRDFPADQRQSQCLAHQMPVSFILRIYRDGSISEHSFRAGGRKLQPTGAVC